MANPTPSHRVVSDFINASPDSAALVEADLRRRLQALLPDSGRIEIPCVNADEARLRRRIRAHRLRITRINASSNSAAPDEDGLLRRVRARLSDSGRIEIPCTNASPNSAALVDDGLLRRVRARLPDSGRIEIPSINADEARLRRRIRASSRRITRINTYRNSAAPDERATSVNGLCEEVIPSLMKTTVYEAAAAAGDPGVCAVCQDNYGESLKVRVLRCRHFFHADCIEKWLEIKNVCPLCNAVVWAA